MANRRSKREGDIFIYICEHEEGVTPSQIAKKFKISAQLVNYYRKKLMSEGVIRRKIRSTGTFYIKNIAGDQDGLGEVAKFLPKIFTPTKKGPQYDNMHNIWYKLKIRKDAEIWFPKQNELNNWVKKFGWYGNVQVAKNDRSSIEIRFRCDRQRDPFEAEVTSRRILDGMINLLEQTYGLELGHPQMIRSPHHTIRGDPVARTVKGEIHGSKAHINRSFDEGELEFDHKETGPYDAKDYLETICELPEHIYHLLAKVDRLEGTIKIIAKVEEALIDSAQLDKTMLLKKLLDILKEHGEG